MRIALLSNVTVDLLAGMLKKSNDVYLAAGFDTWQQEAMIPNSELYSFQPEAVAILLHVDAAANLFKEPEQGKLQLDEWLASLEALTKRMPSVPVFVSSLDCSGGKCSYGAERKFGLTLEAYFIDQIQNMHESGSSIYVLPVKELISEMGRSHFYSPKMWYVGSMPYSMKALSVLSDLIKRYASAAKGAKKKCIALDLDNTLWGGVIGEDGVNGIQLSGHKEGARYKDAQRLLKKMKDQGVMLAILSKNNVEDVEPVFSHPDMLLQHEDFVAEVINWEQKPTNIRLLAKDLNIGLDAFVFLDDNPAEQEQMKALCPEVTVIDFPRDTSQLPAVVADSYERYFFTLEVTGEDRKKTAMYRAEAQRKAEKNSAGSVEDFLKNLKMSLDFHLMFPEEEKRVTQLTNKTNQFNVTTKRYSEEEIHQLAEAENSDVFTVHMSDKYGDQGLVAVLILKYSDSTAEIDTFLMSCRVMGRAAEKEIMAKVKDVLQKRDIQLLDAHYVRTAKNAPVEELFDKLGFTNVSGKAEEIGDSKKYEIRVSSLGEETGFFRSGTTKE